MNDDDLVRTVATEKMDTQAQKNVHTYYTYGELKKKNSDQLKKLVYMIPGEFRLKSGEKVNKIKAAQTSAKTAGEQAKEDHITKWCEGKAKKGLNIQNVTSQQQWTQIKSVADKIKKSVGSYKNPQAKSSEYLTVKIDGKNTIQISTLEVTQMLQKAEEEAKKAERESYKDAMEMTAVHATANKSVCKYGNGVSINSLGDSAQIDKIGIAYVTPTIYGIQNSVNENMKLFNQIQGALNALTPLQEKLSQLASLQGNSASVPAQDNGINYQGLKDSLAKQQAKLEQDLAILKTTVKMENSKERSAEKAYRDNGDNPPKQEGNIKDNWRSGKLMNIIGYGVKTQEQKIYNSQLELDLSNQIDQLKELSQKIDNLANPPAAKPPAAAPTTGRGGSKTQKKEGK